MITLPVAVDNCIRRADGLTHNVVAVAIEVNDVRRFKWIFNSVLKLISFLFSIATLTYVNTIISGHFLCHCQSGKTGSQLHFSELVLSSCISPLIDLL